MAILTTGGAGYIGSHTCIELINAGYDVVVVDNLDNSSEKALERVEAITGKKVTVWAIDKYTANACRLFERKGYNHDLTKEQLEELREEGRLKPVKQFVANANSIDLTLTANGTYLVTVEK